MNVAILNYVKLLMSSIEDSDIFNRNFLLLKIYKSYEGEGRRIFKQRWKFDNSNACIYELLLSMAIC